MDKDDTLLNTSHFQPLRPYLDVCNVFDVLIINRQKHCICRGVVCQNTVVVGLHSSCRLEPANHPKTVRMSRVVCHTEPDMKVIAITFHPTPISVDGG